MKRWIGVAMGLASAAAMAGGESWIKEPIPEELRLPEPPPLPDDQNALLLAVARLPKFEEADYATWFKARIGQRQGRMVEDAVVLERAALIHDRTADLSKKPGRFVIGAESPSIVPLLRMVQAEEMLARHALMKGDRAKMDAHVQVLLDWDQTIRAAGPNLVNSILWYFSWTAAFDVMLTEWETNPDQESRLNEIEATFRKTRPTRNDQLQIIRHEFAWTAKEGSLPEILRKEPLAIPMALKEPFNKIDAAEALKLPYDPRASAAKHIAEIMEQVEDERSGKPFSEWRMVTRQVPKRSFDDYKTRPNGLYDLFSEQANNDVLIGVLGRSPVVAAQIETCLAWLRSERRGRKFVQGDSSIARDPMNGKPLRIEAQARLIRSVGADFILTDSEVIPTGMGTITGPEDPTFRVPRWKSK